MPIQPSPFAAYYLPRHSVPAGRNRAAVVTFVLPVETGKKTVRATPDKPDNSMQVLTLMGNNARLALGV